MSLSGTPTRNNNNNLNNEHTLHNSWTIWEHQRVVKTDDYKNSMREVCEFSTIEEFWRLWTHMPRPSEALYDGQPRREGAGSLGRKIDAFSIFKKGIRPEWEDSANAGASEWATNKIEMDIDNLWENFVLAMLGETIEEDNEICGGRVVDRSKGKMVSYRLELWLRVSTTREVADRVKARLICALADGEEAALATVPGFDYKPRS